VLLAGAAGWSWVLLAGALMVRWTAAAYVSGQVLHDPQTKLLAWLPLRDTAAVLVWLASFMGRTVNWRGDFFTLKDGKLARIGS